MARKHFAALQRIDCNREITEETDWEFLHHLQLALLLALREKGTLNAVQLRQAEENLSRQRRNRAKQRIQKGSGA